MGNNKYLWKFNANDKTSGLPEVFREESLYDGSFTPQNRALKCSADPNRMTSGKLTRGFVMALCRAKQIVTGQESQNDGFGVSEDKNLLVSSFTDSGKYENEIGNGSVIVCMFNTVAKTFYLQENGSAVKNLSDSCIAAMFLSLWKLFMEKDSFGTAFTTFCDSVSKEDVQAAACFLADCAYLMTTTTQSRKTCEIEINYEKEISFLSQLKIEGTRLKPKDITGELSMFPKAFGSNSGSVMSVEEFTGAFSFRKEPLSEEQKLRIPKLDDRYVIGETLIIICQHIQLTTGKTRPIRNVLLRGEPGTGKTEMYVGIAAGCGLPLYTFAANAMTEPYDLFGQFVPVDKNGEAIGEKVSLNELVQGLPTAEDITFNPQKSYERITGVQKEDATPTECMAAIFNLAQKSIVSNQNDGRQKFKFVPGQLITAMKFGGVWGFDEVTLPMNSGVVPSLNPAMDGTQSITLPTGEVVHRHPDCIFVGTTNIDLEGCRRMNQAWQDRCQLIVDVKEPSDEELIGRVKMMTDFTAEDEKNINLELFVQAYHEMKQIVKNKRLDDGQLGCRKLADWVASTMITGDPILSAQLTIIPGATYDERGKAELLEKVSSMF